MKRILILCLFLMMSHIPSYGQLDSLKRVAVLEVIDKDNAFTKGVKMLISSKLSFAITNIPGYEGYDRVDITSIINEHEFQRAGLVNDSQIKRLGEMTGADYILVTEVAKLDEQQIIITAKILNVESAQLDNVADVRTAVDVVEMEKKCNDLAKNLFKWNPTIEKIEIDEPFFIVEQMPLFQGGGLNTFRIWVQNRIRFPQIALENNIQGIVVASFVIERDGALTNIKILKSPDKSLSDEVVRILAGSPHWEPGKQRNLPVRVSYTLPVVFNVTK